jgi:hypothetical protein
MALHDILATLIAILAVYRISQFIAYDDAPFGLMLKVRLYLGKKASGIKKYGFWWSLAELINCPFCVGLWVSLLITPFIFGFHWYSLLFWLAIAGGQAWLESQVQSK